MGSMLMPGFVVVVLKSTSEMSEEKFKLSLIVENPTV
jgi:hypothetical protein